MPAELTTLLSDEQRQKLQREADRRGVTAEVLAGELVERELRARTRPKVPAGNVRPFRRA